MSLFDRFFRKGRSRRHGVDLPELLACLETALPAADVDVDRAPLLGRFAERCREAGLNPLSLEEMMAASAGLDVEGWRRLALAVAALERADVREALTAQRALGPLFREAFVGLAAETPHLTLELLRASPVRREELARQLVLRLGAHVAGESDEQFREQLERLDHGTVLSEVERARIVAEEHEEYLRRLQEEQETLRPRRGKW